EHELAGDPRVLCPVCARRFQPRGPGPWWRGGTRKGSGWVLRLQGASVLREGVGLYRRSSKVAIGARCQHGTPRGRTGSASGTGSTSGDAAGSGPGGAPCPQVGDCLSRLVQGLHERGGEVLLAGEVHSQVEDLEPHLHEGRGV